MLSVVVSRWLCAEKHVELASKEEVDPNEQDRGHGRRAYQPEPGSQERAASVAAMPVGQLHTVASVDDLPAGTATVVEADDAEVAVFNCDDGFYATQGHCLHLGGPARAVGSWTAASSPARGTAGSTTCRTGENEFDRALRLETYEVVVEDGEVKVAL